MDYDAKLAELFIELPEPSRSVAYSANAVRSGKLLFLTGVLPFAEGRLMAKGRVGVEIRIETARQAARQAALQALAIIAADSNGTLNAVKKIIRVDGCVASVAEFHDHHKVIDGAGELLTTVFGEAGRAVRTVMGASSLPLGACVQLALTVELK